ncbi:MAG: hypothetical protein KKA10_07195 [Euryarchaeota archaeon]|nr:hypothetical protein [Euryarchaeota archaeon]
MQLRKKEIGIISLTLMILAIAGALIFLNQNVIPERAIIVDSGEVLWVHYLARFYVIFCVISLTAHLILMHIKLTRFKGFHEG